MDNINKIDPIREKYYAPIETAEKTSEVLFYISGLISLAVLFVNKADLPNIYNIIQIAFVMAVVLIWLTDLSIRLYFSPRAQVRRYKDFISHGFGTQLSHEQTVGYYTTHAGTVPRRIAVQVLENSFYSKDTALRMCQQARRHVVIYVLLWLLVALNRNTDLAIAAIVAQVVFSEQVLSRLFRLEWLRQQFENTYEDLFRLIQSKPDEQRLEVMAWEITGRYEIAKATGAVTLSERIFNKRKPVLEREWAQVKRTLDL